MITSVERADIVIRRCWVCHVTEVFDTERRWVFEDLCHPCAIRILQNALREARDDDLGMDSERGHVRAATSGGTNTSRASEPSPRETSSTAPDPWELLSLGRDPEHA